jgi:antitoxin CptB
MTDDLDVRRRRAAFRATHRGTKELDALIGRFATAHLPLMEGARLATFEQFLAVADPTLQNWIFGKEAISGSAFADLVGEIRAFHGLDTLNTSGDMTG